MRRRIVIILLLGLFAGFGFFIYRRGGLQAEADGTTPDSQASAGTAASSAQTDAGAGSAASAEAGTGGEQRLGRPLRVVGSSWELLAPGIVANGGLSTQKGSLYEKASIDVDYAARDDMKGIREALAKGGKQESGADIAVVPLASFVASYEKLRALKPVVFFVAGRSRGREALATADPQALVDPPERGEVVLRGRPGESATFLSLFLMDLAGIEADRIRIDESPDEAGSVDYVAVARTIDALEDIPDEDDQELLVSTADALGLNPFVAIAPSGFAQSNPEALLQWATTWLEGRAKMKKNVAGSARMIASKVEDLEALELIDLLGWVEFATPRMNARLAGLAGRETASLERLFQEAWRIWRAQGVLSTPSPKSLPISGDTIVELVRGADVDVGPAAKPSTGKGASGNAGSQQWDSTDQVLLTFRQKELKETSFIDKVGLISGIFPRSKLRITVDWNKPKTDEMIERAAKRFDIPKARLDGGRHENGPGRAAVEVFKVR